MKTTAMKGTKGTKAKTETKAVGAFVPFVAVLALVAFFALVAVPRSFAMFRSSDKGTCGAQFLKLGVGARAVAMGEAYSVIADGADALYWNPAGLTRIENRSATFMHAILLDSVVYDYLGYGQNIPGYGAAGASIQYLSVGTIKETDSSGFETGSSFSPRDFAFSLGYAREIEGFNVGIAAKYIHVKISQSASTLATDIGALSPAYFNERIRFSFVMQNLGGTLKVDRESDPLPFNIKLGGSLAIDENWTAALDLNLPKDNNPNVALGTEYRVPYGADWNFSGRFGFNSRTLGDVDGFTGLSFGLGAGFRQLELDYAFVPFGTIGHTHRISVGARF